MFDFVRNHSRVLFFVMVLLIFPSFVFFGIQGYSKFNEPTGAAVAKVDGQKISRAEWDAARPGAPAGGTLAVMPPSTWRSIRSWRMLASKPSAVSPCAPSIAL